MGQLTKANSERPSGSLPSNTEENPSENLKAITLRSGKQVETRVEDGPSVKEKRVAVEEDPKSGESMVEGNNGERNDESQPQTPSKSPEYKPPIRYQAKLR